MNRRRAERRESSRSLPLLRSWMMCFLCRAGRPTRQAWAEFFVSAMSVKRPFKWAAADAGALENWFAFPTLDVTPALFRAAVDFQQRFQRNYWDAAILAAAKHIAPWTAAPVLSISLTPT